MDEELNPSAETEEPGAVHTARVLGYVGLGPFVILSLWLYGIGPAHPWRDGTILLLVGYAAVILSFLAGIRWGAALGLAGNERGQVFFLSIVPPILGWVCLVVPAPYCFALLAVAFAAHGAWDTMAVHATLAPRWYGRLRTILTVIVVATLILAFFATA